MKFYSWETLEDFENWHTLVKSYLELPKAGINASTNLVDDSAQWTESYTSATKFKSKWIAPVEESISTVCVEGLGIEINAQELAALIEQG
jgi:hypothetical protein